MTYRKKLIEVALPLEAINDRSAVEKSIRHGHPSTLHLWWARRPLAACRAVLFASLIDDPGEPGAPTDYLAALDELDPPHPKPIDFDQLALPDQRRQRLFAFLGGNPRKTTKQGKEKIEWRDGLVDWDRSNDERMLETARRLIRLSCEGNPPPVLDPFCGGGSIPLEAQRLGLEAHASDLNPVAVLITKALIEIPPRFSGRPPVHPAEGKGAKGGSWRGATGLAEDVRYYGKWMRDEAEKSIGHLYPKAKLPDGKEATVIAWLWARTVTCPNPACGRTMPLLSSFVLSSKSTNTTFLLPSTNGGVLSFSIVSKWPSSQDDPKNGYKRGMSGIFECAFCRTVTSRDYVASEGMAGRLQPVGTAIVAEGSRGRVYLPISAAAAPTILPPVDTSGLEAELSPNPRDVWCRNFGLTRPVDLFTPRQLVALTTFSDLVGEARERVLRDAIAAGLADDGVSLESGGSGAHAYADAVATYLGLGVSKLADAMSSLVRWKPSMNQAIGTFGRQALPMVWDFAESNVFNGAAGDLTTTLGNMARVIDELADGNTGTSQQVDAMNTVDGAANAIVSTDPPYYDNIGYADLSDFFYVWLRRSLATVHPGLFKTLLTPKAPELVATPYRFEGDTKLAETFFRDGLQRVFENMRRVQNQDFPLTVFYAFKQADIQPGDDRETASTGWETMLHGLLTANFEVTGTWPMRTELANRTVGAGTNALASSIVLVCRPRSADAPRATRQEFEQALRRELPAALATLKQGAVAPVDLQQAVVGPGMAVFSRYSAVLEASGQPMPVRTALQIINANLDRVLSEDLGQYDPETRWAVGWFEQYGPTEGAFGDAETLFKRFAVSFDGLKDAGVIQGGGGKVRLKSRAELHLDDPDWDPRADPHYTTWELTQYLARMLLEEGDEAAGRLMAIAGPRTDAARDLAYRLYNICERKGWSQEALAYNALGASWLEIAGQAANAIITTGEQGSLL